MFDVNNPLKFIIERLEKGESIVIITVELRHGIHFLAELRRMLQYHPKLNEDQIEYCNATSDKYKNGAFIQLQHEAQAFTNGALDVDVVLIDRRITAGNWEINIKPYIVKDWKFTVI